MRAEVRVRPSQEEGRDTYSIVSREDKSLSVDHVLWEL